MTAQCTSTCLASHGSFTVERCSCGWFSVHVGAMTLRLETAAMEQLATILGEAAVNNHKLHAQEDVMSFGLMSPIDTMDSPEEAGLNENKAYHAAKNVLPLSQNAQATYGLSELGPARNGFDGVWAEQRPQQATDRSLSLPQTSNRLATKDIEDVCLAP